MIFERSTISSCLLPKHGTCFHCESIRDQRFCFTMAPKPIVCANTEKNFNKNLNNFLHNFSDKEELLNELDENKNQIIEKYNDEIIKVSDSFLVIFVSGHEPNFQIFLQVKASDILWRQVLILIVLHIGSVYGIYLLLSGQARLATFAVCTCTISCQKLIS